MTLSNKKTNQDDQIDRISDLPCNVIDEILAHLEVKDLVRTSVLSKKWRYMWTFVPRLWFSEYFLYYYEDLDDPGPVSKIITDVLMQHNGPIHKFHLFVPFDYNFKITMEYLDMWIPLLSRRGLKYLDIRNFGELSSLDQLPYIVFSCKELISFDFGGFNLSIPPNFSGFKRLLNLHLFFVTFEPGALESLISGCPLLKKLDIEGCYGFEYFDFSAPTLEVLRLEFYQDVKSICLKKAKNLIDLRIMAVEDWVSGLIKSLPKNIQRLYIGSHFNNSKILYADILPPTLLKGSFSSIKYLELCGVNLNERGELLYIVGVLKSAPALVELVVQIDDVDTPQVSDHSEELECSSCCLKLQTVSISVRASSQPAMRLIQFILANSTSLKTLTFNVGIGYRKLDASMLLRISQELLWMKRASQRAHVKFLYKPSL